MPPLVLRDPSMTEKTQTWLEIRNAVPAINCTGGNPVEVRMMELGMVFLFQFHITGAALVPGQTS